MTLLAVGLVFAACSPAPSAIPSGDPASVTASPGASVAGATAPPAAPGHELYGFLPYWEMRDGIAAHLRDTPLTTLALFSVTHTGKGALNTGQRGYKLITGDVGATIIREAHERGTRVEVVYTSFGAARNRKLFEDVARQDAVIASLVALVA